MWRLPGLVCRALNRFHAPNVPSYVHGEAEALSPSSLIPLGQNVGGRSYTCNSSSHQTGQNGQDGQKKKETYRSFNCQLPHYSVLDAFGWGAAAVFFLQLARHASFQSSVTNSPREDRCTQRSYLEQILHSLAQTQNNSIRSQILPKRAPAGAWNDVRLQEKSVTDESGSSTESTSLASSSESGLVHPNTDEDASQLANSVNFITVKTKTPVPDSVVKAAAKRHSKEVLVPEDNLGESLPLAASKLLDVVENSVPVVLNISGIISARDRADYNTAFQFFQQSADSGYSKAQFNTGVCYEQGRGVEKDINKAAAYYLLAGKNGHMQAKYRFARCILQMQSKAKLEDIQTAVQMLKEAADAGLKEAQAYLGVLYTKEPYLDPQTAVRYIWMAAENGDNQSRYYLGVCYEKGYGVPANRLEALRHYERVAKTGHGAAKQKLNEFHEKQKEDLNSYSISLKAAASSPCLPVMERVNILAEERSMHYGSGSSGFRLPQSMSTGNLLALSQAASSSYTLAPVQSNTDKLKMVSLKLIGVG